MKWKREDDVTVTRKVIEAMQKAPEDIKLCAGYTGECEAWGLLEAKSKEQAKAFITENIPEMEIEVKPVLQFYPPSLDLYTVIHQMITQQ